MKMRNLKKTAYTTDWRHSSPREKAFILTALSNCASSEDVDDVLRDFSGAVVEHMRDDDEFLASCLTASLDGKAQQLGEKFEALFAVAVRDVLAADADRGGRRTEEVFERLFALAVDRESPDVLEELLQLAHGPQADRPEPLLRRDPLPNSKILARACGRDSYALIKLLVDRGHRLKPYEMGDRDADRKRVGEKRRSRAKSFVRLILNRVELDEADTFEANDEMRNLRIMDLAVRPSYISACYSSLAEKYDWEEPIDCECRARRGNYGNVGPKSRSGGLASLSHEVVEEGFHHCPAHKSFRADVLCSHHLECNDPVTRCFLLAKKCSQLAEESYNYAHEYREEGRLKNGVP